MSRWKRGIFLINAHRIALQLHFDVGFALVSIAHIPGIPIDFGNNRLRKFIRKLTNPEVTHMSHLEHYKKKQSRLYDTAILPNEIKVSGSSKAHDLCTKAIHKLKEHSTDGVIVSASGSHVTKAVTVVELLKRRVPNLHQETQLKYVRVEDVWQPDMEDLDSLKVVRRIPAISMHLIDTSTSTSPMPAGEQHTAMATSSEQAARSESKSRREGGSHRGEGKEKREKGKGQGSRSQGGGVKKPGKKTQSAAGGHGRVKGRTKSARQASEVVKDSMDQT